MAATEPLPTLAPRNYRTPADCRYRDNPGERAGRIIARVCRRLGVRYRLFRRQTDVAFPEIDVTLPRLPRALDGLRAVQIADLHASILTDDRDFDELFARVRQCRPDLLLLTGDNVSYHTHLIEPIVARLGAIETPLGSFAVLGNHDYWEDANETARCYEKHGIRLLVNEWALLEPRGHPLVVAGLDDYCEGAPDLEATLAGVPDGVPVLLLSHIPCVMTEPGVERADLVLSGHVHGGLVNLPGIGPITMPEKSPPEFVQGHYRTQRTQLYVSAGIGTSVVWFRWKARPEVPTFILRAPGV